MPWLNEDAYSNVKNGVLLGKQGTRVDIIRDCGNATLVVDEDGNRFSIETKYLTDVLPVVEEKKPEPEKAKDYKGRRKATQGGLFS